MTHVWPLEFRPVNALSLLLADDAGASSERTMNSSIAMPEMPSPLVISFFFPRMGTAIRQSMIFLSRPLPIGGQDDNRYERLFLTLFWPLLFAAI
jgi:hypothetical protein